ncbi:hypothetical protein [Pseudoxanthomonas broegbernensis]|uniref:hypothetical protein n=1 Tax=Pseudoxanthomonas broegbernensis TaxID=83619 RepID=UPI0013914313|nr:hypothetical protein [Pseudoxanthomonas broegbernensis]MBB6066078.1 hypothetical protein [Pseudoxanthomonas broegbernensis]
MALAGIDARADDGSGAVSAEAAPEAMPDPIPAAASGQEAGEAEPVPSPPAVTVVLDNSWQLRSEQEPVLRLVTRGDTAKATTAKVAGALLSAFAGGTTTGTFSKEQLKGKWVDSLPDPTGPLMVPMLQQRIEELVLSRSGPVSPPPLRIEARPGVWTLIYQELGRSDTPYELRYQAVIVARDATVASAPPPSLVPRLECRPEPQTMTLAKWQDDGYARVHEVAADYARQCTELAAGQLEAWLATQEAPEAPEMPPADAMTPAVALSPPVLPELEAAAGGPEGMGMEQ